MRILAEESDRGQRLDIFLQRRLPEFSRSRIQGWIKQNLVRVNQQPAKVSFVLHGGESIEVEPAPLPALHASAEDISLSILYEDEWLVAIDKPAGMVVHSGAGVSSGTVVNALLHRFESLSSLGGETRPGIVHRLDRFTSGVLLAAKTDAAHQALARLFATRKVRKLYRTLVHRPMEAETGRIEKPITRDPAHRTRMTARLASGRAAWSEWTVLQTFPNAAYLQVLIGTGRTHQIRVHLSSIGHPVFGDKLYGAPAEVPGLPPLGRYFLHAHQIELQHPFTDKLLTVTSPLAPELSRFLEALQALH
jgi:23S rRNA pseudouridine1911/1915/1917 synthase